MTISDLTPKSFNHQFASIGGHRYHYVDEGNKDGKTIIFVHGFLDLWYGWRHQIRYLASLGLYRVLAVDMLGYGLTDKPMSLDANDFNPLYTAKTIAGHLIELMDRLGIDKAVMVGHDWGAGIVSRAGWHYPNRLYSTISVGNPFRPVSKDFIPVEEMIHENPAFEYFPYFASTQAIEDMDRGAEAFIEQCYPDVDGSSEDWSKVRAYYLKNFVRGGFQAPLGYYKGFYENYMDDRPLVGKRYTVPFYMLNVENDLILHPKYNKSFNYDYVDTFEEDVLKQGEHFCHAQFPDELNGKLRNYLGRLFGFDKAIKAGVSRVGTAAFFGGQKKRPLERL